MEPARHLVNVVDLRRRLGQRREEAIEVVLAQQVVVGSRTVRRPVTGSLVVESIERGVSAMGLVRFDWEGDCRRCLELVVGSLEVEIAEIFQVGAPEDSEIIDFDGEQIDLVPIVCDAVALSLPLAPLCRPDCVGPDPERYPALTAESIEAGSGSAGDEPVPDPRWAALDQLEFDDSA
jgi:uncharacterized protein